MRRDCCSTHDRNSFLSYFKLHFSSHLILLKFGYSPQILFLIFLNIPPPSCSKYLMWQKIFPTSFFSSLSRIVNHVSISKVWVIYIRYGRIFYHAWVSIINRWWYNQGNQSTGSRRYGYLYERKTNIQLAAFYTYLFAIYLKSNNKNEVTKCLVSFAKECYISVTAGAFITLFPWHQYKKMQMKWNATFLCWIECVTISS